MQKGKKDQKQGKPVDWEALAVMEAEFLRPLVDWVKDKTEVHADKLSASSIRDQNPQLSAKDKGESESDSGLAVGQRGCCLKEVVTLIQEGQCVLDEILERAA